MLHERIEHFEAGSDAVAQHKWYAGARANIHPDLLTEHREKALHVPPLRGRGRHGYNTMTSATHAGRSSPSISYVRVNTDSTPVVFCCALITVTAARICEPTLSGDGNRTLLLA